MPPHLSPKPRPLPGTEPLTLEGDLAAEMVAGIDRFLMRECETGATQRETHWKRVFTSHQAYVESVEPNRRRLREMIGLVDPREAPGIQIVTPVSASSPEIAAGPGYQVYEVRWNTLKGVDGEGLLLQPEGEPVASVVSLPDCDVTPEMWAGLEPGLPEEAQVGRRLAENGCRVLIPLLIDRRNTHSGAPEVRLTHHPHREFIYRAAYELGRHIVGYEVQKVLAAVDALSKDGHPVGLFGHGEGGLIAFYASAVDTRIRATAVSGYFQPRENLWQEPIYRNLFGLLREFGDAEIAGLVAPRPLILEASRHPEINVPAKPPDQKQGPTPGRLHTPPVEEVETEFERARSLVAGLQPPAPLTLIRSESRLPGSELTLAAFLQALGSNDPPAPSAVPPDRRRNGTDAPRRFKRQFDQLVDHTQRCLREAEFRRADYWSGADATDLETWQQTARPYRDRLWEEVIGPLPPPSLPPNPRTRLLYNTPRFKGYQVVLDVYPNVFACGILLVPKRIRKGDRRPVVVCQHGLEGRPENLADPDLDNKSYHRYACRLADRGFVTYAPQNPYIGGDTYRTLQRKGNPLKLSLFSFIVRQHEQTLTYLSSLPFVDPDRIAFYGLSYGGKTAMRVPAILEQFCLSICSADYNEWIWKNASTRHRYSYMFGDEYDMAEFNLGNTFNYAEMSWLICPRPFMVERGHHDGVAPDEWVAYEYAKTQRRYVLLGIGDRTEIEFFNGPHTIHGVGTFDFLHRRLNWPKPKKKSGG